MENSFNSNVNSTIHVIADRASGLFLHDPKFLMLFSIVIIEIYKISEMQAIPTLIGGMMLLAFSAVMQWAKGSEKLRCQIGSSL